MIAKASNPMIPLNLIQIIIDPKIKETGNIVIYNTVLRFFSN